MNDERTKVLVVDDELGMREGCRKILLSENYVVETAEDGIDGLEKFRAHGDFAIVLVDLNMPRMGGLDLIERLKSLDEDVVIFVITAYAAIDTAVEATRRGAYGYIPKPFTPDELILPVRNGLERRALAIEARRLREERENRLLEVAVERSQSSTIIACMTDGVLVVNRDGQIVLRNAAMVSVMPNCTSAPLPAPLDSLDVPEVRALVRAVLGAGGGHAITAKEIESGAANLMLNASPVLGPSGDVIGAVVVVRDITELKRLDTAKSMFISMVAHEIKSPLATVENYLNAIQAGLLDDDHEKRRHIIERCLFRISTLRTMVSDLTNLTAIETGKFTLARVPVDIREAVVGVVDVYKERAEEKRMTIRIECEPDVDGVHVLADKNSLYMVFSNLVDNAIKYTPAGGEISVRVEKRGGFVQVSVKDTGIGMTPDQQEHVFDEFFRAKNEYTVKVPGTGLGLTLVKRLVEAHQGHVSVESVPKRGSTFSVRLPLAED